jgi:hypothetical protein
MIQSQPTIRMTILDSAGNEQVKQCFYAKELDHRDHSSWYYVNVNYNKVNINGNATKRYNTFVDLSKVNATQLDQINVSIVRGPTC